MFRKQNDDDKNKVNPMVEAYNILGSVLKKGSNYKNTYCLGEGSIGSNVFKGFNGKAIPFSLNKLKKGFFELVFPDNQKMLALEIQGESFMFSGLNSGDLLKKYA
jgi:hypothetical protein